MLLNININKHITLTSEQQRNVSENAQEKLAVKFI